MISTSSLGQLSQDGAPPSRATNRRPTRRSRSGARRRGGLHLSKVDPLAAAAVAMEQIEHPKRDDDDDDNDDDGGNGLSRPGQESKSKNDDGARPGMAVDDRPASYRSILDFEDAAGGASAAAPPAAGPCGADGPFTASAADASPPRARRPLNIRSCLSPSAAGDGDGDGTGKRRRKSRHVSFSQRRVRVYESRTSFVGIGWRYNPRETVETIGGHDAGSGDGAVPAAAGTASPIENLKDLKDLDIQF